MGEIFFTIFLFFGVFVITAIVFGGWVVVSLAKIVIRGINQMLGPTKTVSILPPSARTVKCPRDRCIADNPHDARFCRRCGQLLPGSGMITTPATGPTSPEAQRVQVRRAAML